jgi:GAF domain-containing protein
MRHDLSDAVMSRALSAAGELLPATHCLLWRLDSRPGRGVFCLEASRSAPGQRPLPPELALEGSVSQQALTRRCSQAAADLQTGGTPEAALAQKHGLASLLCVPLVNDGLFPPGVLHAYTRTRHHFTPLERQTAEALALLIETLWQRARLKGEIQHLKEELKTRKRVDRAKEVLMEQRQMSAEAAYRWIQKRSMDTRRTMREVAETILLAEVSGHYSSIPHALDFSRKPPRK